VANSQFNVKVNSLQFVLGEGEEPIAYDIVLNVEGDGTVLGLKLVLPQDATDERSL
jgi:hypothetical protein